MRGTAGTVRMRRDERLRTISIPAGVSGAGVGFRADTAGAGSSLGEKILAAKTRATEECRLRMRPRIARVSGDSVQVRVLSVRDYFPDLRCRGAVPRPVRGGISETSARRIHRDARVYCAARRRAGVGVDERSADVEISTPVPLPGIDEGLRSELNKQGIFTIKLQDVYNWG